MVLYTIQLLVVCAALVATVRPGFLTLSGGLAALCLAAILIASGGIGILPAALFFLPASLLSNLSDPRTPSGKSTADRTRHQIPPPIHARKAGRSAIQVLVNGAPGAVCYALWVLTTDPCWMVASLTSFAAASADTWSTEVGIRSGVVPRLITSGRSVPAGISGAVSNLGLLASVVGSMVVVVGFYLSIWGLHAFDVVPTQAGNPWIFLSDRVPLAITLFTVCGVVSGLIDSLAGATIQERFRDSDTGQESDLMPVIATPEARTEADVNRYQRIKGIPGINNDVVNLICTLVGAFLGHLVCSLI